MSSPEDEEAGNVSGEAGPPGPIDPAETPEEGDSVVASAATETASPPESPASFIVRCAACGAETSVTTDQAGKRGRCGVCGGTFLILPPPGFGSLPDTGVEPQEVPPFDGPPHRAATVLSVGLGAMLALALAVVVTSCCPYVPVDLVGVGVGIAAWWMGRRDLRAMDRGQMDPAGREKTRLGYALGLCAAAMGTFLVLLRVAILGIVFAMILLGPKFKPVPPGGFAAPPPMSPSPKASPSAEKDEQPPVIPPDAKAAAR